MPVFTVDAAMDARPNAGSYRSPSLALPSRCPRARPTLRFRRAQGGGIIFKLIGLMALALLVCGLYLVRYPLLRAAGRVWIVEQAPEQADAIVVLGDNYRSERTERAAELFRAGWAPRVVASGRMLRPYSSVAELMRRDLRQDNVPEAAIVVFSHTALNTRDEITALAQLFRQQGWRKILLVTSSYHSRHTAYICRRILPPGTEFHVIAAHDSSYDPDSWWKTRLGLNLFFHEAAGMTADWWELRRLPVAATDDWSLLFPALRHFAPLRPRYMG
jgi:uncharacterized SAM-binding protein YcdF (DUF218 family)